MASSTYRTPCRRSPSPSRARTAGSRDANRWVDGHLFADFHRPPPHRDQTSGRHSHRRLRTPPPPSRSSPTAADCKGRGGSGSGERSKEGGEITASKATSRTKTSKT